jgi:hypothetical protein
MHHTSPTRRRSWFFAVLALLATTAQLAVALAPLAEGREGRATVHVESGGTPRHYQHNDATCAACQARSIHGTAPRLATPVIETEPHATVTATTVGHVASADLNPSAHPRAPPAVI